MTATILCIWLKVVAAVLLVAQILKTGNVGVEGKKYVDVPCVWNSKKGAEFDLRPLTIKDKSKTSYRITDGDIPCTPEIEPSYTYDWNFCQDVTTASIPEACKLTIPKKTGVALQSIYLSANSYDCYIFGTYDPETDDLHYSLLDPKDPSKGVSMRYPNGEKCNENHVARTATVDVTCANTRMVIESAEEPDHCQYHLVMKSYYGCPIECPVTSTGLCSSHGHCAYDYVNSKAYCFCNDGYGGNDCNAKVASSGTSSYDGHSVQLGLMVTLIVLTILLIGVVGYMYLKIKDYRREQQFGSEYSSHSMHAEMVETVHF